MRSKKQYLYEYSLAVTGGKDAVSILYDVPGVYCLEKMEHNSGKKRDLPLLVSDHMVLQTDGEREVFPGKDGMDGVFKG